MQALKKTFISIIIITIFIIVLLWILSPEEKNSIQEEEKLGIPPVTVIKVTPKSHQTTIEAMGITQLYWATDLVSAVSGRIAMLALELEPGSLVKKDQLLAQLLDTAYIYELASAKAKVAETTLELSRIKNEQYVKLKINKGQNLTEYGELKPHIAAAQAQLKAAQAQLEAAQQQLNETKIKAPFPAIIIKRHISPSQWVNAEEKLFQLASSDFINIKVELAPSLWQRLGDLENLESDVIAPSGKHWIAELRYLMPVMDAITRQRSMVLTVAQPYIGKEPLLPDEQVKVRFQGALLEKVVKTPASVLSDDGKVWTIDHDNKLLLEDIELINEQPEYIIFRFIQHPDISRKIVLYPLSTMLQGQKVEVKIAPHIGAPL